ncbi:Conserved_hypothetical protein [Hexamita inflata]|uniref:Uncharacterized protein n=1 Tax=Hexamita inflata TaxID=28002 RepID=A0AA86RH33_9EUKA|nr:Conserved hypothetical protein [Hexamita inflata]
MRQQNQTIDWSKQTVPLPYVFQDLEKPIHELSEVFLPGEMAPFQLTTLKEALLRHVSLTPSQLANYNKTLTECSITYTGQLSPRLLQPDLISDELIQRIIQSPTNPEELHISLKALLCYALGLQIVETPALPLRPDVVVARSLRLSIVPNVFALILRMFATEAEYCCQQLENPTPDSNAAKQVTPVGNLLMQLLHLMLTAQNISKQNLTDKQLLIPLFQIAADLTTHLSGVVQEKLNIQNVQTFTVPNARCFASIRALCLLRQTVLKLLGPVGDFKQADTCREKKKQQEVPIEIKRLPPPRFYGFVNQQCGQLLKIQEQFNQFPPNLFKKDSPVKYTYNNQFKKQQEENDQILASHIQKINQKKQRGPLIIQQEQDFLTIRRESLFQRLFNCYPEPKMKGSIEGVEQTHAAAVAMQLAADCRVLQQGTMSVKETPSSGQNTVRYNPQGSSSIPEVTETTTLMRDKLNRYLTKSFQYCGRPGLFKQAVPYLRKSLELNLENYEALNLNKQKIIDHTFSMRPLDIDSSILQKPLQIPPNVPQQSSYNLLLLLNSIDLGLFLQSLTRLTLCSVPNTSDSILNKHALPDAQSVPTNNHTCSVRHVREVVLKTILHLLLMIQFHSKQIHPTLHRFIQKQYQQNNNMDGIICILSMALGAYCSVPDQRFYEFGLCLFSTKESESIFNAEELNADCSEFLLQKSTEIDALKPLNLFSSSRRLYICTVAGRLVYGEVMHARSRQLWFAQRFQKISSNYVSAILQSTVSGQSNLQQDQQDETNMNMSQTQKNMNKIVSNIADFGIRPGSGRQQSTLVYQPTHIYNFIEFLNGNNAQNNPQRSNMAATLGCTFPCYQLIRINNMSAIVTFLKLSTHLLPAVNQGQDEHGYASAFEVPGLQAARETTIKLAYQLGISCRQTDAMRWNKDVVYYGADARDYLELRSFRVLRGYLGDEYLQQIDQQIVEQGEGMQEMVVESLLGYVGLV